MGEMEMIRYKQYKLYWRFWRLYVKIESLLWACKHGLLLIFDCIRLRQQYNWQEAIRKAVEKREQIVNRELDEIFSFEE